jgi:hypothetical protein
MPGTSMTPDAEFDNGVVDTVQPLKAATHRAPELTNRGGLGDRHLTWRAVGRENSPIGGMFRAGLGGRYEHRSGTIHR